MSHRLTSLSSNRRLRHLPAAGVALLALTLALTGCEKEPERVIVVREGEEDVKPLNPPEPTEEEAYAERVRARENAPEPTLDPEDPREQFRLIWTRGEKSLRSIHQERFDILRQMQTLKLDDKDERSELEALAELMQKWTVGDDADTMETAAERLCALIDEVRPRAEALMDKANAELERIGAETTALEEKQAEGGTVYQRQWEKLDDERRRWSGPLQAGRFVFLAIKSMLEEAFVLADFGPRRAQLALRDCLGPMLERPLPLDLAQSQLEKVVARSKWYREGL